MRIYIPALSCDLQGDVISPRIVHAVTAQLERTADLDDVPLSERRDVLEAMAMNAAADDSLRALCEYEVCEAGNPPALRRIVIVGTIDDGHLATCHDPDQLPTALEMTGTLSWRHVESIHIDDDEALEDIDRAVSGDETAFERTYGHELMWYDVDERDDLLLFLHV